MKGLVGYATYLPRYRLAGGDIGVRRGDRVVAAFDEDSTTMAVAAIADIPLSRSVLSFLRSYCSACRLTRPRVEQAASRTRPSSL